MTNETRPTSEQVRLVSSKTGEHILDSYLEASEKGNRTLPDLLDDLFNASGSFYRGSGLYNWKGNYTNGLPYVTGDTFIVPATGSIYVALRNFTASNNQAQEVIDNKISLIFDGSIILTATTSATNAANSATAAATSASSAASSASTATTQASNASTSAAAASGSATAASISATAAQTSATNAANSASAAAASANAASSSQSAAATSATNAATSATAAASSQSTASSAAAASQTSATNSAGSATIALNAASGATTQASNASASATSAATSATNAANSATAAANSASAAAASAASINPANIAITGGTINNATIGATTPASGAFTTLALGGTAITASAAELNYVDGVTSNVQTQLNGKAASSHTHTIANVTNLQTTLDGKAASVHTHAISDVTNLQTQLDGKAASSHTHTIANVTGLQTALDAKAPIADPTLTGTATAPRLRLTDTADVGLTSTGHALQVGLTASFNLALDTNEIQARNNGAASTLILNAAGGNITLGAAGAAVAVPGTLNPTAINLPASCVGTGQILSNAVTAAEIAADAVTSSEIADNAVISSKIATNAVTTTKIADDAITAAKIAAGAVYDDAIAVGNIAVLIGNLTTTSGTTRTLSGLDLASYRTLMIVFRGVSINQHVARQILIGDAAFAFAGSNAADVTRGIAFLNLTDGTFSSTVFSGSTTEQAAGGTGIVRAGRCSITTADTSISVVADAGAAFDAGSILFYGIK